MRAVTFGILLVLLMAVPACENGPPWGGGGAPTADDDGPDFGPTAVYNHRLIFLGPGADLPTTAVFDFTALSDSIGLRQGVRVRVVDGAGWRGLMDAGWEMESMRAPWRLVPHGPLKMVVGETGDLAAVIHRDSVTTRLALGSTLAELSPDVGTQLVLRRAQLVLDGRSVPGILLDAQLGRAVNPELAVRADTATGDDGAPADSAGFATPIARPGAEALLLDNAGYYAVLAAASAGPLAWTHNAGRNDVRSGTRLEPTTWSAVEDGQVQVPTAWRVVSPDGELTGELAARATDRVALTGAGELEALVYTLVSGWVEDRSVRRDVFGLVRHVR